MYFFTKIMYCINDTYTSIRCGLPSITVHGQYMFISTSEAIFKVRPL